MIAVIFECKDCHERSEHPITVENALRLSMAIIAASEGVDCQCPKHDPALTEKSVALWNQGVRRLGGQPNDVLPQN